MTEDTDDRVQENSGEHALSLIDISYRGMPEKTRNRLRRIEQLKRKTRIRRRILHKKLVKGSAVSLLGISIALAGLFPSSSDLLRQQAIRSQSNPAPVEMMLEQEIPDSEEENRKKAETGASGGPLWLRLRQILRAMVLRLPLWLRACAGLPLWAAGSLVIHLAAGLFQTVLTPVLFHLAGFVLCAAVLLGVYILTMKSLFPHLPLKKILRWKHIRRILAGAAFLKLLDILLPLFWGSYTRYKYLVLLIAGALVLGLLVIPWVRRFRRGRKRTA